MYATFCDRFGILLGGVYGRYVPESGALIRKMAFLKNIFRTEFMPMGLSTERKPAHEASIGGRGLYFGNPVP